jgi:mono/diheme cytochrome c family protein
MVPNARKIALGFGLAIGAMFATCALAQNNAAPAAPNAMAPAAAASANESPLEMAQKAPKGTLVNPYAAQEASHDQKAADAGHQVFMSAACPGCHGGGGGGGMCPPITNGVWIYGDADDTLFRLIALGSVDLQKQGYTRQAIENIVAPMPSFGSIMKSDDIWKIITWVKIQAAINVKSGQ